MKRNERKSKPGKARIAVLTTVAAGMILLIWVFVRKAIANCCSSRPGCLQPDSEMSIK